MKLKDILPLIDGDVCVKGLDGTQYEPDAALEMEVVSIESTFDEQYDYDIDDVPYCYNVASAIIATVK